MSLTGNTAVGAQHVVLQSVTLSRDVTSSVRLLTDVDDISAFVPLSFLYKDGLSDFL